MAAEKIIWVGLACCLAALAIKVFPDGAFRMGVDVGASWLVFGFGVFLLLLSALLSFRSGHRR